jgi:hypothetical protein
MKFFESINEVQQQYSSAKTSLNQVSAGHKKIKWKAGTANLDWGGGKSDMGTKYLKDTHDVTNYVYDPFNRSAAENAAALKSKPDTITSHNVLNVIQEDEVIIEMMKEWKKITSAKTIYITVYEGNRSGEGKPTSKGYQRNMKLADYLPLVQQVFPSASKKGTMIVINK